MPWTWFLRNAGYREGLQRMNSKQRAAQAALAEITEDQLVGIGTGSTADCLMDMLPSIECPPFFVASSSRTQQKLKSLGYRVQTLNETGTLDLYIDGADQVLETGVSLKGGGGCHTIEKVLATNAKRFVGMATANKLVKQLDAPVAIEVLDVARSSVARAIVGLGGEPKYREGFKTDAGNCILDIFMMDMRDPEALEKQLQQLVGVIEVGIFACRRFDVFYIADDKSVEKY